MKDGITLDLILRLSDYEIFNVCTCLLGEYYGSIQTDDHGFIYATGGNPSCLVAHIDTKRPDDMIVHPIKRNDFIINKHGVLGADDRAGVYMILSIIRECVIDNTPLPSVLLTNYEECGIVGVQNFIDSNIISPDDNSPTKIFVGLDRCGFRKCAVYKTIYSQLAEYIAAFDFKLIRSIRRSDLSVLANTYPIPSINLSIGYYLEHTSFEMLNINQYVDTYLKVLSMVKNPFNF